MHFRTKARGESNIEDRWALTWSKELQWQRKSRRGLQRSHYSCWQYPRPYSDLWASAKCLQWAKKGCQSSRKQTTSVTQPLAAPWLTGASDSATWHSHSPATCHSPIPSTCHPSYLYLDWTPAACWLVRSGDTGGTRTRDLEHCWTLLTTRLLDTFICWPWRVNHYYLCHNQVRKEGSRDLGTN